MRKCVNLFVSTSTGQLWNLTEQLVTTTSKGRRCENLEFGAQTMNAKRLPTGFKFLYLFFASLEVV